MALIGEGEDFSYEHHNMVMDSIGEMHGNLADYTDNLLHHQFSIDPNDKVYNNMRQATSTTLTVASLAAGTYGLAKGAIQLTKLCRAPSQIGKISKFLGKGAKTGRETFRSRMSLGEVKRYDKYWLKHAPEHSTPYSTLRRYTPEGKLKQVTTYNQFGLRHRQYDLIDMRRMPHQHNFEYGLNNPNGIRSTHLPIDE